MALLTSAGSSGGESPVKDSYTVEFERIDEFEEREGMKFRPEEPDKINVQAKAYFRIVDFDYDPSIDSRDWNDQVLAEYFIFQKKEYHRDDNGNVVIDRVLDSYLDKRSGSYDLITALMGRPPTREDEIDFAAYEGQRLNCTIEPKDSGWPKVHNFSPARRRRAAQQPVAQPTPEVDIEPEAAPAPGDLGPFKQSA